MRRSLPLTGAALATVAVLGLAPAAPAAGPASVSALFETIDRKPAGVNDADDPAFWINSADPSKSLIIGTVKEAGLDVYRLDASLVQTVTIGSGSRYNNVAVVQGVTLGNSNRDLAIVSDRGTDKLHVFAINGTAANPLTEVTAAGVPIVFGGAKKVKSKTTYGLTAWHAPDGKVEVFVTQENTTNLAKVVLTDAGNGKVGYEKTASLSLPNSFTLPGGGTWKPCFNPKHPDWAAHVEGMVVDPATETLWADQEIVGLWKLTTDLTNPTLVHKLARFGQTYSTAGGKCKINTGSPSYGDAYLPGDLEGIGLYESGPNDGYLVISNQMASTYAVFKRDGGQHVGDFKIVDSAATDKVDSTDGLDVINVNLGPQYPQGLLVTQDGKDAPAGGTNFKLTPWHRVAAAFTPPL